MARRSRHGALHPWIQAAFDPVGSARVASRLSRFVALTKSHLNRVPNDVEQVHMNALANAWANVLLNAMGISMLIQGEPAGNPGALLVSNHRSYVDIIALLASTPCCFLAKDDVANWPVLGTAAVRAGTIFVDRKVKDSRREARRVMAEVLSAGHSVVVFPEGTTFPGPGAEAFRIGAFEAAHEAGVPVVPIAIEYGKHEDAWGDESFLEHFVDRFRQPSLDIHLHFGPALHGLEPEHAMVATRNWITDRLNVVWNELRARELLARRLP